jgi:signal transduction histidine kinase
MQSDPNTLPAARLVDVWLALADSKRAPGQARGFVGEHCGWLTAGVRDDLELLVSELVTNAVIHGRPAVSLHLITCAAVVRVDVFDRGAPIAAAIPAVAVTSQRGGRGLSIVDTLATRWGSTLPAAPRGKSVWFEIDLPLAS